MHGAAVSEAGRRSGARGWWCRVRTLCAVLPAACSPALDWREVRPAGTAVVALLPCKPQPTTRTVPLAGQQIRLSMLACKAEGLTWALAAADVGDPTRVGAVLEALRGSAVANLQGAVTRSAPAAVPGATPHAAQAMVEVRGRKPDGAAARGQFLLFSHGTQVFEAMVIGADLPAGATDTFFGSLRVVP